MNTRNIPAYWRVFFVYLAVVTIQIAIILERGEIRQSDTELLLIYTGVNLSDGQADRLPG